MSSDCIVVGGCGFVGSVLIRQLAEAGKRVLVIDLVPPAEPLAEVEYLLADVRDQDSLMRLIGKCPKGAWVIHLAARWYQGAIPKIGRQEWFSRTNVAGAMNVCQFAARLAATGLVWFSTDMVYGLPRTVPVRESHDLRPIGEYGTSKVQMERRVTDFAREQGLPLTVFRPRLIAGKGRLGVFTKLFYLIDKNLPLPLIGNGRNVYQMVSVDDCASAVLCALDKGCPSAVYNLGSRPTMCVYDLMRAFRDAVQSRSRIVPTPAMLVRGGLRVMSLLGVELLYPEQYRLADKNFIVSIEKAQTELGWHPQKDDLEMMIDAYNYWKQMS